MQRPPHATAVALPPGVRAPGFPGAGIPRGPGFGAPRGPSGGRDAFGWIVWPWVCVLMVLPLAILALAEDRDRTGLILAYVNVALIGSTIVYFVTRHTFAALVPVLWFSWLLLSWPSATIYMGLFEPEARYVLVDETYRRCLDGNERMQFVVLIHALTYLMVIALFAPKGAAVPDFSANDSTAWRLGVAATLLAMFAIGIHAIGARLGEGPISYIGTGAFIYLNGFPFIIGALFPRIPIAIRGVFLGFLIVVGLFYLVAGARTWALLPFVLMVAGLLFCAAYPQRIKLLVILAFVVGFPIAVVFGETTQALTQTKGFERFEERQAQLQGTWRQNLAQGSTIGRTFGRTFSTGGHSIVTLTPESYDYLEFNAGNYLTELVTVIFVPGAIYGGRYYASTTQLKRYGMRITEKTSVELSFVGSLWLIGGWLPLIVGTALVAVMHALMMRWIHSATLASPYQGLFYVAMTAYPIFWGYNLDPISHTRGVVLGCIAAMLVWYIVIMPFVGVVRRARGAAVPRRVPMRMPPGPAAAPQAAP